MTKIGIRTAVTRDTDLGRVIGGGNEAGQETGWRRGETGATRGRGTAGGIEMVRGMGDVTEGRGIDHGEVSMACPV